MGINTEDGRVVGPKSAFVSIAQGSVIETRFGFCPHDPSKQRGTALAEVRFEDLVAALKLHPEYERSWKKGVPAEQSLYIRFAGESVKVTPGRELAEGGHQIIVDRNNTGGKITGIEIV